MAKGLTASDIKEIFTHLQAYVGFSRALNGVESQLGSHLQLIKHLGITQPELKKLIDSLNAVNPKQIKKAQKVLEKM